MADDFPEDAVPPSLSVPKSVKPKTRIAKFGDNYSQRSPDGLNFIRRSWSLTWDALTEDEKDTIVEFFEEQGGYKAFNWIPPNEVTERLVCCPEWDEVFVAADIYNITATFGEEIL